LSSTYHDASLLRGALVATLAAAAVGILAVESPLLALAGVLGLAFGALALRDLAVGLALFTLLVFFQRLPALGDANVTYTRAAGFLLAGAWLLAVLGRRPIPLLPRVHPTLALALVAFVVWGFASTLWAGDSQLAYEYMTRVAQGVLLYFIVVSALRRREHIWLFVGVFVFGTLLTAIIGIVEGPRSYDAGRLSGEIGDPNQTAAAFIPAVALAGFAFLATRRALARIVLLAAAVLIVVALFMTESRGGLVGLGAALIAALIASGPYRPKILVATLCLAALGIAYFTYAADQEARERALAFSPTPEETAGRTDLWKLALQMSSDHPVLGVGARNFMVTSPSYATSDVSIQAIDKAFTRPVVVHNTYLQILAELGTVGLFLFASVVIGTFLVACRAIRFFAQQGARDLEILARGMVVALVGLLSAYTFLSGSYEKALWLLLGCAAALSAVALRERQPRESADTSVTLVRDGGRN
jgi:O-antigen ligase